MGYMKELFHTILFFGKVNHVLHIQNNDVTLKEN